MQVMLRQFIGCGDSHWIDTPNTQPKDGQQVRELPTWSVRTFSTGNPSSPVPTPDQDITIVNTNSLSPANASPVIKVVPKRVAPPPPKDKRKKCGISGTPQQQESAVYAVPITHWFSRKKKPQQKSTYKELDLSKMEGRNLYSIPNTD